MPDSPTSGGTAPSSLSKGWPFAAIFFLALLIRLAYLMEIKHAAVFSVLMGDSLSYDQWAEQIAHGDWLGKETFYQAPFYPYFLASLSILFHHDLLIVRIVQAILGASACLLLALAGRAFFSANVGVLAGGLLAVYGPSLFFDGLVQKTVLDELFLCLLLFLLGRILSQARGLRTFLVGLVLGGLCLTRENALALVPIVGLWLTVHRGQEPLQKRLSHLALFIAGITVALTPVGLRNLAVGGEFFVTTAQFGPNFYIGNNEKADGRYKSLRWGRGNAGVERQDATDLAQQALGRRLTPGEVSAYWTERALAYIRAHPVDWLALMLKKAWLVWNAKEIPDTDEPAVYADESRLLRTLGTFIHFGIIAPLALLGIWVTWPDRRRLWILYLMILTMTVSVALFYVFARYRYPLVPLLMLFASAALWHLVERLRERADYGWGHAGALLLATAMIVNWPQVSDEVPRATTYYNLGVTLAGQGRLDQAVKQYSKALAFSPNAPELHVMLAEALSGTGQPDEGIAHYRTALQLQPENAQVHYAFGLALARQDRLDDAILHYEEAIRIDPTLADARAALAGARAARSDSCLPGVPASCRPAGADGGTPGSPPP